MSTSDEDSLSTLKFRIMEVRRVVPSESDSEFRFRNYYRCPSDGTEWADQWSCKCNDRCPRCGDEIEPYKSENI